MASIRTTIPVALLLTVVCQSAAAAQTPVRSFADLRPLLEPGQTVVVTDGNGGKTTGQFVSILGNQLEIKLDRIQVLFSEDSVRRLETKDRIWNGILIGLGAGTALAAVTHARCSSAPLGSDVRETCGLEYLYFPVLGAIVGGSVDRSGDRLIYLSPGGGGLSFGPALGRNRVGIAAILRF